MQYAQNAAPTPLGTKLTVPASSKVPDGYEPVWYKNTITRARYPDFFTQLVDTNSLVLVDEETYDNSSLSGYINGNLVFRQYGNYGHWEEHNSLMVLVCPGDIVRLSGGGELAFMPCKGV